MGDIAREIFGTGNRVEVYLRGQGQRKLLGRGLTGRMGEATDASIDVNTGNRPLHVIGSAPPVAHVDGAHTYQLSLAMLRLVDRGAADLINAETVDVDWVDKYGGTKIQTAEECSLASGSIQISANNPITRNLRFNVLRVI